MDLGDGLLALDLGLAALDLEQALAAVRLAVAAAERGELKGAKPGAGFNSRLLSINLKLLKRKFITIEWNNIIVPECSESYSMGPMKCDHVQYYTNFKMK